MTISTDKIGELAIAAIMEFNTAAACTLDVLGADIRDREGKGWDGPRVQAWIRGVELAEQVLAGVRASTSSTSAASTSYGDADIVTSSDNDAAETEVCNALEQCDTILSVCDDVPERGSDFADSVREKTISIRDWIEENDHVTDKQLLALDNMESAINRWIK